MAMLLGGAISPDSKTLAIANCGYNAHMLHLIDLARWFLGEFTHVTGFAHTYFWDMPVDDNAFLLLRTAREQAAFLHVSCTEWKNLFSLEIYGTTGKLQVEGLGGLRTWSD